MHVSPTTITFDLQYLRKEARKTIREYTTEQLPLQLRIFMVANQNAIKQYWDISQKAQDNLQHHIHEVVPEEYQKCITGMKSNLKETLEIANTSADPRVKLQARAIANDCYKFILDMTTNAGIVSETLKYVTQKTEQVNTLQKLDERIEDMEEEPNTSGIF